MARSSPTRGLVRESLRDAGVEDGHGMACPRSEEYIALYSESIHLGKSVCSAVFFCSVSVLLGELRRSRVFLGELRRSPATRAHQELQQEYDDCDFFGRLELKFIIRIYHFST